MDFIQALAFLGGFTTLFILVDWIVSLIMKDEVDPLMAEVKEKEIQARRSIDKGE